MSKQTPWSIGLPDDAIPWDVYGAWETWIMNQFPEYLQIAFEEMDSVLSANLYAITSNLALNNAETQ